MCNDNQEVLVLGTLLPTRVRAQVPTTRGIHGPACERYKTVRGWVG